MQSMNNRERVKNDLINANKQQLNRKSSSSTTGNGRRKNNQSIFMPGGTQKEKINDMPPSSSTVQRTRVGRSYANTVSRTSESLERDPNDIDAQVSREMLENLNRAGNIGANTYKGYNKAKKVLKTAKIVGKAPKLAIFFSTLGILILAIIVMVGIASFLMNMPGMVRDKLVDMWDTFWQEAKGTIFGQKEPTATEIKNLAEYLESMGYDLKYNGFVTKLEKDEKGNIKDIESKYLAAYISAEQRNYLIANENYNVVGIWKNITGLLDEDTVTNDNWGTGMIVLGSGLLENVGKGLLNNVSQLAKVGETLMDYFMGRTTTRGGAVEDVSNLTTRVILKRDTKEMYISNVDIVDAMNRGGYDVYRYSLKEWTEKYGTPMELFLTLHLATRAPEFAYNFATMYDTKVYIEIKKLTDVEIDLVYAKTDKDNKIVLDENGKPTMIPVRSMSNEEIKAKGISEDALQEMRSIDGKKVEAFTPYITKVLNHWYYQQIIYQGEYEDKNIDVYEIRNLKEGDDGYLRYYAYTRRDNADASRIEEDSKKVELAENSTFWGIYNFIAKVVATVMTSGYAGISGLVETAAQAALDEAYKMLSDAIYDEISSQIKGLLPDQIAGMIDVKSFLKGNLSLDQLNNFNLDGININNMKNLVDFNKMAESLSIDNLKLEATKFWDKLNLKDELMNMDIAGLGSANDLIGDFKDLQSSIKNFDSTNIKDVLSGKLDGIVDFSNTGIDKFTENLRNGFKGSIPDLQKSILASSNKLFSGLSEADFKKISDGMLDDLTKEISDEALKPILDELDGPINDLVSGKYKDDILSGLKNEYVKQTTGIPYEYFQKLSELPNTSASDITGNIKDWANSESNKFTTKNLADVNSQISSVKSALTGAETSMNNLAATTNKLSTQITGMDTKTLASITKGLKDIDTSTLSVKAAQDELKNLVSSSQLGSNVNSVYNDLQNMEALAKQIEEANQNLDTKTLNSLMSQMEEYKSRINNTISGEINKVRQDALTVGNQVTSIPERTLQQIEGQLGQLESSAQRLIDHVTVMDEYRIASLKHKLAGIDKTGIVDLATTLSELDMSANGAQELVQKYGTDLTGLSTSDLNTAMSLITDKNLTAQKAMSKLSPYLMRADENNIMGQLSSLNSTVSLLKNAQDNMDLNTVAALANRVPGLDATQLNVLANKLSVLENITMDDVLKDLEDKARQICNEQLEDLERQITQGIKDQISKSLSQKLKEDIMNTGTFSEDLKKTMTTNKTDAALAAAGAGNDIDLETEDQAIDDPYSEYSTGFYVREIRHADYFQTAEPLRVLYSPSHWVKMFREDKYLILDTPGKDMSKIEDKEYLETYGKTLWEAFGDNLETNIYAMLQGLSGPESQYLFRYFKELFNDMSWVFDGNFGISVNEKPGSVNPDTFGWIFKTVKVKEPVFVGEPKYHSTKTMKVKVKDKENIDKIAAANMPEGASYFKTKCTEPKANVLVKQLDTRPVNKNISADAYARQNMPDNAVRYEVREAEVDDEYIDVDYRYVTVYYYAYKDNNQDIDLEITYYAYEGKELQEVEKAEYQPATWAASKMGILQPKSQDSVYGFDTGLDIVSPVDGVIVSKTEARVNELGDKVSQSITIELRETGDPNADGMRVILIGGDYSALSVGSVVRKITYELDGDGNMTGNTSQSVIGKTTDEPIKVMVLGKDQAPVSDVSEYVHPPYETYKPQVGGENNAKQ